MYNINTLGYDKITEIAWNMGYDPTKLTELNKYISEPVAQIPEQMFMVAQPSARQSNLTLQVR